MYSTDQDPSAVLAERTSEVEDSIERMLKIVGPTPPERALFFKRFDIRTTPAEYLLAANVIRSAQQAISQGTQTLETAAEAAALVQG